MLPLVSHSIFSVNITNNFYVEVEFYLSIVPSKKNWRKDPVGYNNCNELIQFAASIANAPDKFNCECLMIRNTVIIVNY